MTRFPVSFVVGFLLSSTLAAAFFVAWSGSTSGGGGGTNSQADASKKSSVLATKPNAVGMKMVKIPAGSFTMGSPQGESGRLEREVNIK